MNENEMRELDVRMATEVMGWHRAEIAPTWVDGDGRFGIAVWDWYPTTSWGCAGMVLDKMAADGWEWDVMNLPERDGEKRYCAQFILHTQPLWTYADAEANDKALAVSLAARKAKEAADDKT